MKRIIKALITHISLVPKGANGKDFLIVKNQEREDSLIKSVPILKTDDDKRLVTGVVYAPDTVDSQGDFMEAEAIEESAHEFMKNYRNIDIKHSFNENHNIQVVESYIAKSDFKINNELIKKGTWLMTIWVNDDEVWESVKRGEFKGFSMGGTGIREEVKKENEMTEEQIRELVKNEIGEAVKELKALFVNANQEEQEEEKEITKIENNVYYRPISNQLESQESIQKSNTKNIWANLNL